MLEGLCRTFEARAASTPGTGKMLAVEQSERKSLIANESLRSPSGSQAFAVAPSRPCSALTPATSGDSTAEGVPSNA